MGQKFLLDVSPTGVEHHIHIDNDGDQLTAVEHTPTRVENAILDTCAQARSLHQAKGRNLQFAARIPINTYFEWKKEWKQKYSDTWSWPTFEAMKLNSRDNEKLRTGYKRSGSMRL